jgi:hypothetical protein
MSTFYVTTQSLENYSEDPKTPYWKYKFGRDFIVTISGREQDAIAAVMDIMSKEDQEARDAGYIVGTMSKEYVSHVEEVSPQFKTDFELHQLEDEGKVHHPATRVFTADGKPVIMEKL